MLTLIRKLQAIACCTLSASRKQRKSETYLWKTLILLVLGGLSAHGGLSKLEAISMIESGDNDRAIGGAGEISRYQIKPKIWRTYSQSRAYADARISTWVAQQHLNYLETLFRQRAGREPTDFDRYVLWNGGFFYYARVRFVPAAVHPVIRGRAQRYVNLRESKDLRPDHSLLALRSKPDGRKQL